MTDVDREQLKRDLSEALSALRAGKSVRGFDGVPDRLIALGDSYWFHGMRLRQSIRQKDEGAVIADVVQVLDKLERGMS